LISFALFVALFAFALLSLIVRFVAIKGVFGVPVVVGLVLGVFLMMLAVGYVLSLRLVYVVVVVLIFQGVLLVRV